MDFDIRVPLIVLQAYIEARPVLLDQVHLKDERLELRSDHDPFDICDVFD